MQDESFSVRTSYPQCNTTPHKPQAEVNPSYFQSDRSQLGTRQILPVRQKLGEGYCGNKYIPDRRCAARHRPPTNIFTSVQGNFMHNGGRGASYAVDQNFHDFG